MIFKLYWIIYAIYLLHIGSVNVSKRITKLYNANRILYSILEHIYQVQQHNVREQRYEHLFCGVLLYQAGKSPEKLYESTVYAAKTHTEGYRRKNSSS